MEQLQWEFDVVGRALTEIVNNCSAPAAASQPGPGARTCEDLLLMATVALYRGATGSSPAEIAEAVQAIAEELEAQDLERAGRH
jgi:hypothetical protein